MQVASLHFVLTNNTNSLKTILESVKIVTEPSIQAPKLLDASVEFLVSLQGPAFKFLHFVRIVSVRSAQHLRMPSATTISDASLVSSSIFSLSFSVNT